MIEFPELFGSPYVLPVIIVIVVLLLAFLLLMVRRRRHAASVPTRTSSAMEKKGTEQSRPPVREPLSRDVKPLTRPAGDSARPEPTVDPLKQVLDRILEGWGDLTSEDLNRLKVFRKERVVAAIAALEVPKELKGSRYAQSRLHQLRAYAATIREGGTVTVEEAAAAEERAAESFWGAAPGEEAAVQEAATEEVRATEAPPVAPSAETVEETVETAAAASEATGQLTAEEIGPAEEEIPTEAQSLPDGQELAEPATQERAREELTVEEVRLEEPLVEEVRVEEAPVEEVPAEELPMEEAALVAEASETTGDDLGKLALLSPEELAQAFENATDPRTKMAIIDQLEHLASPKALEIIRRCLDDPDLEVQLHALEAADRLLGAGD